MKIPIVNEQDEIIGYKERSDKTPDDIIRITALWATSPEGDILLAQRAYVKEQNPGKWGPAVSGTVEEGETYEINVYKETEEEIGLTGVVLHFHSKTLITSRSGRKFGQIYTVEIPRDTPLRLQEIEVEKVQWFTKQELIDFYNKNPELFTPTFEVLRPFFE